MTSFNVMCTFVFPFAFKITMRMMYWGMPQWAPVCLWYSYLVHVFYGNSDYMSLPVSILLWVLRAITPVMFLMEGVSEKCFALDMTGSELLAVSGILASIKRGDIFHPITLGFTGMYILVMSCVPEQSFLNTLLRYCSVILWLNVFYLVDHLRDVSKPRTHVEMVWGV